MNTEGWPSQYAYDFAAHAELARDLAKQIPSARASLATWRAVSQAGRRATHESKKSNRTALFRRQAAEGMNTARAQLRIHQQDISKLLWFMTRFLPEWTPSLKALVPTADLRLSVLDEDQVRVLCEELQAFAMTAIWKAFAAGVDLPPLDWLERRAKQARQAREAPELFPVHDVGEEEREILSTLFDAGPLQAKQLARKLDWTEKTVSKYARRLADRERPLIEWPVSPAGKRLREGLKLTEYGRLSVASFRHFRRTTGKPHTS